MSNIKRTKNFATIFYPESLSYEVAQDFLDSLHIAYLISPIHNADLDKDGNLKKEHYHVVLVFDSLKSVPQVKDMLISGFVGLEMVQSLTSYARYLCHLDNPEKAQYSVSNVFAFGLDYNQICHKEDNKYDAFSRVIDFIVSTNCTSFARLLLHAKNNDYEMFRALCDNSFAVREFIKSYTLDLRLEVKSNEK